MPSKKCWTLTLLSNPLRRHLHQGTPPHQLHSPPHRTLVTKRMSLNLRGKVRGSPMTKWWNPRGTWSLCEILVLCWSVGCQIRCVCWWVRRSRLSSVKRSTGSLRRTMKRCVGTQYHFGKGSVGVAFGKGSLPSIPSLYRKSWNCSEDWPTCFASWSAPLHSFKASPPHRLSSEREGWSKVLLSRNRKKFFLPFHFLQTC